MRAGVYSARGRVNVSIRVPLEFLKPTMRLARPIADAHGRLVAGTGTLLGAGVVRALRKLAIQTVLVGESEDIAPWERAQPLQEQLRMLEQRLDREPANEAMAALRTAITRHLCKRAIRLERERDLGTATEEQS
jgi:hypothetical protein